MGHAQTIPGYLPRALPYKELLEVLYGPWPHYPGYGYSMFSTRSELLSVLHAHVTIPGSSGSYLRRPYLYPELLDILYDPHTLTHPKLL